LHPAEGFKGTPDEIGVWEVPIWPKRLIWGAAFLVESDRRKKKGNMERTLLNLEADKKKDTLPILKMDAGT